MSRAEDLSQNRYPTMAEKYAFIDGYEQAEKDLELSWEDVKLLIDIIDSESLKPHLFDEIDYQEVLKRFKDYKERKDGSKR